MPAIRTILHPTDFSENSAYAFGVACSVAEKFNARLILFHAALPSVAPGSQGPTPSPLESVEAQHPLKGQYAWPQPPNQKIAVEHRVAEGGSSEEILRIAQRSNCDLIVMGTHGRTGLKRVLMGSVAEEVLRKAVCPVLAMKAPPDFTSSVKGMPAEKQGKENRATLRIQNILHPTDFSPRSEYAFEAACLLAEAYAARLILLHVIPASSAPILGEQPFNPLEPAEKQENVKWRFAWPQPPNQKIVVEHRVAEGNASEEVLGLAQHGACDLIVMGTQGRTGLERVLTGSVAEEVLRNSGCPVLTVKTPPGWSSSVQYSSSSRLGEIVDVRPLGWASILKTKGLTTLLKTDGMEVVRLSLPQSEKAPESETQGETLFQCLEGKVAFTAYGKTQRLGPGRLLYLPRGEFFSVEAVEDASLLLTIHLPKP